jgi:hypothetical protein
MRRHENLGGLGRVLQRLVLDGELFADLRLAASMAST